MPFTLKRKYQTRLTKRIMTDIGRPKKAATTTKRQIEENKSAHRAQTHIIWFLQCFSPFTYVVFHVRFNALHNNFSNKTLAYTLLVGRKNVVVLKTYCRRQQ